VRINIKPTTGIKAYVPLHLSLTELYIYIYIYFPLQLYFPKPRRSSLGKSDCASSSFVGKTSFNFCK